MPPPSMENEVNGFPVTKKSCSNLQIPPDGRLFVGYETSVRAGIASVNPQMDLHILSA